MDTLKRVGSIRKSMRSKKRPSIPQDQQPELAPEIEEIKEKLQPCYFTLTCTDTVVTAASTSFQPTHLKLVITRHRKTYSSNSVLWEPSLKFNLNGAGVWHPPFVVTMSVSPPLRSKSDGTLRHKDAFVNLENIDVRGKKKLLAKARVNLSDYYVAASVSPILFKLKLYPETSKISSAYVHFSIYKTEENPAINTVPPQDEDEKLSHNSLVEADTIGSAHSSDMLGEFENSPKLHFAESPARPISLRLKNSITVEKPKPAFYKDNNNDLKLSPPTPETISSSKDILDVSYEATLKADSCSFADDVESVNDEDALIPANKTPDKSRLLAEPEDTGISTPKGPIGLPPPLPKRSLPPSNDVSRSRPPTSPLPKPPIVETEVVKELPNQNQNSAIANNVSRAPQSPFLTSQKVEKIVSPKPAVSPEPPVALTPTKSETQSHSPFRKPSTPVKIFSDHDDSDSDSERQSKDSIRILSCPSPRMTPKKQLSVENDLLEWAKKSLVSYSQIKVTNLSSSWRNGLGFCALIHKKFPSLIPFNRLKMQNMTDNCTLAFEAAKIAGMKTVVTPDSLSDKPGVVAFLNELRYVLSKTEEFDEKSPEVIEFKSSWFQKCGFFEEEVGHLFAQVQEEVVEVVDENPNNDEETTQILDMQLEIDQESRDRVREKIAAAHREAENNGSFEDVMITRRLRESKTISEELSRLASQQDKISREKLSLERILRDESISKQSMEHHMHKWVQLINLENSLVTRQMQLNIEEQEKVINLEMEEIQWRLQKIAVMDDSQKTEEDRNQEQTLLSQLISCVNKKNELVINLDSQEKAIAENERIQKLVENRDFTTLGTEVGCVLQ